MALPLNIDPERMSPEHWASLMAVVPPTETGQWLRPALQHHPDYHPALHRAFRQRLATLPTEALEPLQAILQESTAPLARVLGAECQSALGHRTAAAAAWQEALQHCAPCEGHACLQLARLGRQNGQAAEAARWLRQGIPLLRDYESLSAAGKLIRKLKASVEGPSLRLALLSTATTALLEPVLEALAYASGFTLELYTGPYGSAQLEMLRADSGLYAFGPEAVVVLTHWRDLALPAISPSPPEDPAQTWQHCWQAVHQQLACPIIQSLYDLPANESAGALSDTLPAGRRRLLHALNEQLLQAAPAAVHLFAPTALACAEPVWEDARQWHMAKQHPAASALPVLGQQIVALLRAVRGQTRKVLVTDLDQTLWGGVIGDDGVGGIELGPPSARGEAFQHFQQYLRELKERGILLAVCSRNEEANARIPFEQHDGMALSLADFVSFKANWLPKPENLRAMARELNLGLDSFVFVDDNPAECAHVRATLPEVAVVQLPEDPADYVARLDRERFFEALTFSREDQQRHASYQANAQRQQLQNEAASPEQFLRGLHMRATSSTLTEATLPRVEQLVNKTNQFNLTTRRRTLAQLRQLALSTQWWCRCYGLADRFGDYGIVAVLLAEKSPASWKVDTFLMSCRVFGRGLEHLAMNELFASAQAEGASEIHGEYLPTAKNGLVADFYPRLGFTQTSEGHWALPCTRYCPQDTAIAT